MTDKQDTQNPYGYIFGGCTFLRNGSPLVTDHVLNQSIPVFLQPAKEVMKTYKEVMAEIDAKDAEIERLRGALSRVCGYDRNFYDNGRPGYEAIARAALAPAGEPAP